MAINAETLIQAQKEEQQQVESFASANQQTLEERVAFLENLMRKHLHNGVDGSKRIGGIWKRLSEKILNAASATVDLEIPEGYRIYRLTIMGGVSAAAYLQLRFNGISSASYGYNLSILQATTLDADSTSVTTHQAQANWGWWGNAGSNVNVAELMLFDPPTFINTYRNWLSRGNAQSDFEGLNQQTFIGSGVFSGTNAKLKTINLLLSTGNFNLDTTFLFEGLTV